MNGLPTLAARIDSLYKARTKRLALQKEVETMFEAEKAATLEIGRAMGLAEASGMEGRITRKVVRKVVVDNWPAFQAHILATKDLSLLESRVMRSAIAEHWQSGDEIPGVIGQDEIVYTLGKA